jgi:hypothetical protein
MTDTKATTPTERKEKIEVWLTDDQFNRLMDSSKEEIKKALGATVSKEGKRFGMEKVYRQKLTSQLQNFIQSEE